MQPEVISEAAETRVVASYGRLETALGTLWLGWEGAASVAKLTFVDFKALPKRGLGAAWLQRTRPKAVDVPAVFGEPLRRFAEEGKGDVAELPVRLLGTDFQNRVWSALRDVPAGETITYGELAEKAGSPAASRAVGSAMAKNPLPLAVPCHRVVQSTGALGNYSGGGPSVKRRLLQLEGIPL